MAVMVPLSAPPHLMACPECDLLFRMPAIPSQATLLCTRCNAVLRRSVQSRLNVPLAYALASMIFFVLANSQPLLALNIGGQVLENTLFSGVLALSNSGMWELAGLVFFTSLLAPFLQIFLLIYVLLPLHVGYRPWRFGPAFRLLLQTSPWSMLGIYLLGIMVAMVKLRDLATVDPGLSLFFFAGLILTTTAAKTTLNPEMIWSIAAKAK